MNTEALLRDLRQQLHDGGLHGCLLVRDLHTGEELGIEPDTQLPSPPWSRSRSRWPRWSASGGASWTGRRCSTYAPGRITTPGPTGLSRFRHPARIAVDDLLYLSTC